MQEFSIQEYKQPLQLKEDLNELLEVLPKLALIVDEDFQEDLPDFLEEEEQQTEKNAFIHQTGMFADLMDYLSTGISEDETIQTDDDIEGFINNLITNKYNEIATVNKENKKGVLATIRSHEETLRAANLFFENAGSGKIKDAYFLTVDPEKFAGTKSPAHFKAFKEFLQKEFYAFEMKRSPAFIGYIGDVGKGGFDMAAIAQETVALAVVDTIKSKKAQATLDRTRNRKLRGDSPAWAHLVVSGAWLEVRAAYEDLETNPLLVPAATAIMGKLMSTTLSKDLQITGFAPPPLKGVAKTAYDTDEDKLTLKQTAPDRRDSGDFREQGMMLPIKTSEGVKIIVDRTANTSDKEDVKTAYLRKVSSMTVRNKVMKDLVAFCNLKIDDTGDMGSLKSRITLYLNNSKRKNIIKDFKNLKVVESDDDTVDVFVELEYYSTKSKYNITILGTKGELAHTHE